MVYKSAIHHVDVHILSIQFVIRTVKNVQEVTAPAQHVMTANGLVGLVEVLMSVVSLVLYVLCTHIQFETQFHWSMGSFLFMIVHPQQSGGTQSFFKFCYDLMILAMFLNTLCIFNI